MFATSLDRVSRVVNGFGRRRRARMTRDALHGLDDRTLRDIGIDRSEIMRVVLDIAAEPREARRQRG